MSDRSDLNETSAPYSGPRAIDPPEPEHRLEDDPDYVTRTKFLSLVAIAGGAAMTAAIFVPIVGFAVAPTLESEVIRWIDIGELGQYPVDATTGTAINGQHPESDRRVFIRRRADELLPIWNRCAHLGCPVGYAAGSDGFSCPCHGGAYDSRGLVTAGPPARPLDRFDYKIVRPSPNGEGSVDVELADAKETDRLLIGAPYSINEQEEPFRLHGAGEPVSGPLRHLYPSPGA